jgi:hypothetical protein
MSATIWVEEETGTDRRAAMPKHDGYWSGNQGRTADPTSLPAFDRQVGRGRQ